MKRVTVSKKRRRLLDRMVADAARKQSVWVVDVKMRGIVLIVRRRDAEAAIILRLDGEIGEGIDVNAEALKVLGAKIGERLRNGGDRLRRVAHDGAAAGEHVGINGGDVEVGELWRVKLVGICRRAELGESRHPW